MKTVIRSCTKDFLENLITKGVQYDVLTGIADIEAGDVIVYEDEDGKQIGRYIANIKHGHELNLGIDQGSEHNFTILGLETAPAALLEAMFKAGSIMIGVGIEIVRGEHYILGQPQYLPVMSVEAIDPKVLLDAVKIQTWPDGCFSLLFLAKAVSIESGRPVLEIMEYTVMALTNMDGQDVFVEVDSRVLKIGKIRDKFGRVLEPYFGLPHAGPSDEELDQTTVDQVMQIVKGDE